MPPVDVSCSLFALLVVVDDVVVDDVVVVVSWFALVVELDVVEVPRVGSNSGEFCCLLSVVGSAVGCGCGCGCVVVSVGCTLLDSIG